MCFNLIVVCETIDMPLHRIFLIQLTDDLGDVHETLATLAAVLQQQA